MAEHVLGNSASNVINLRTPSVSCPPIVRAQPVVSRKRGSCVRLRLAPSAVRCVALSILIPQPQPQPQPQA